MNVSWKFYIFGTCAVVAMLAATFFIFKDGSSSDQSALAIESVAEDDTPFSVPETRLVTEGVRAYENKEFRFSLLFPKELELRQYKEKGHAMSITFNEPDTERGFQIFVTPYAGTEITKERFQMDQPSGIMDQPTDVMVDGVRATMFFSKNQLMGDVREVWFINNGFLYEVVTYKELDEWLSNIMQSWKFI